MNKYDTVYLYVPETNQIKCVKLAHQGLSESVIVTTVNGGRTWRVPNDLVFETKKQALLKRKSDTNNPTSIQEGDVVLYNTNRRTPLAQYGRTSHEVLEEGIAVWVPALVLKATPTRLTLMCDSNTETTVRKNCILISKSDAD
jgi:hypothetical protein